MLGVAFATGMQFLFYLCIDIIQIATSYSPQDMYFVGPKPVGSSI
jgi:hypothetical protein